jgi:hypothetical protein
MLFGQGRFLFGSKTANVSQTRLASVLIALRVDVAIAGGTGNENDALRVRFGSSLLGRTTQVPILSLVMGFTACGRIPGAHSTSHDELTAPCHALRAAGY